MKHSIAGRGVGLYTVIGTTCKVMVLNKVLVNKYFYLLFNSENFMVAPRTCLTFHLVEKLVLNGRREESENKDAEYDWRRPSDGSC